MSRIIGTVGTSAFHHLSFNYKVPLQFGRDSLWFDPATYPWCFKLPPSFKRGIDRSLISHLLSQELWSNRAEQDSPNTNVSNILLSLRHFSLILEIQIWLSQYELVCMWKRVEALVSWLSTGIIFLNANTLSKKDSCGAFSNAIS